MGILEQLKARVEQVQEGLASGSFVREVISTHGEDILAYQRHQLLRGLASSGEDMRPYYSEDLKPMGRFYSVETAGRYAALKQDGIRYPYSVDRNPDAPNLYFNGRFHEELGVQFDAAVVAIVGTTSYAKKIISKYGESSFGLMAEYWGKVWEDCGAYAELLTKLKDELNG